MAAKHLYLIIAVVGTVIPYAFFVPFLIENGLDVNLFFRQMFETRIAGFFSADVIISALAVFVLAFVEGGRLGMQHRWVYVLATVTVGVSLSLPLFLYTRERKLEAQ